MNRERDTFANVMAGARPASKTVAAALERLQDIYPVRVVNLHHDSSRRIDRGWDGEVTLKTDRGTIRYLFAIKTHLRPQTVRHLQIQADACRKLRGKPKAFLLLADYVNPHLGHQLKEAGIDFIDTAGNLFLKQAPGLHLYVEGKKPQVSTKEQPARLFQPSGLSLLFGLLVGPESVNWLYRDLARANGVALGTVSWIMRDLREHGYLEPLGKHRFHLTRKHELLDRWVEGYAIRLRPKILVGEFVDPTRDLDTVADNFETYAEGQHMHWGLTGGFGAFELLHHYRGLILSIVLERWDAQTALAALHLLPREGGDVRILRSFSPVVFTKVDAKTGRPVVHPLLVYAELLYEGGDRALETARQLYDEFLEPLLAKDR